MKKILLTTTALTLIAGVAAADMSVTGDGRIGVISRGATAGSAASAGWAAANDAVIAQNVVINNAVSAAAIAAAQAALVPLTTALAAETAAVAATAATTTVDHRLRVYFNASGETDGGLTFGAKAGIRWDDSGASGFDMTRVSDARIWISNGTATLTVGNATGAIGTAGGVWGATLVGYTAMSLSAAGLGWNFATTSTAGAGSNVATLAFSLGSANVALSTGIGGQTANDTEIAANFSVGGATIGVGYDTGNVSGTKATHLTIGSDLGSANVHLNYVSLSTGVTNYSLSASMGVGSGTAKGYVGRLAGGTIYGLGYSQSLGGGATAAFGYESIGGVATMEAGLSFSF